MVARQASSGIFFDDPEVVVDAKLQQIGLHRRDLVGHRSRFRRRWRR